MRFLVHNSSISFHIGYKTMDGLQQKDSQVICIFIYTVDSHLFEVSREIEKWFE